MSVETHTVVITDSDLPATGAEEALLRDAGLDVRRAACRTAEDVIRAGGDADALIVQWAPITAAVLDRLPACRFVSRLGIGYDMIDVAAAAERGVAVANTPGYCVEEVTTHTMAMVLALCRGLPQLDRSVRKGRWSVTEEAPSLRRPSETRVVVVGFGRIGSRVARAADALGFDVAVHDDLVPEGVIAEAGHVPVDLGEALESADVLSLHVPLTPATRGLIDRAALARMKPGSQIVNTCRGGLFVEDDLAASLGSGHTGGAALDVFAVEPLPLDHPLRRAPNVILSPHAAWYSPASLAELPVRAAQQVIDFLAGRPVPSIVNDVSRPADRR
jgi:D-3-phosphoglycerate dehydrogenase / 2-oxoglutarate reductase